MRDYLIAGFIFAILPVCLTRPWLGILAWYWFGLMNPHRLTWGFAYSMQFGLLIGGATLLGLLFAKDRRPIPWNVTLVLVAVLMADFTVTTIFAWAPERAWQQWEKVVKVIFMTFIATKLIFGRERIRALMLTVVVSIGFYGVKGGIQGILKGGAIELIGVPDSFLDGNTFIGLAFNMVFPLMIILAREEKHRWARRALYAAAALTVVATIFTYSRGAYLGLIVTLPLLFLHAKRKVVAAAILIPAALLAPYVLPERVFQRVDETVEYQEDPSANQRLFAWTVAANLARDYPLTGGGFNFEYFPDPERWLQYGPQDKRDLFASGGHSAHSIYFQILGQHGYIGLILFVALLIAAMLGLQRTKGLALGRSGCDWVATYATALQVGLAGYLVSGTFLSSAYFDLAWLYFALSAILAREVRYPLVVLEPGGKLRLPDARPAEVRER